MKARYLEYVRRMRKVGIEWEERLRAERDSRPEHLRGTEPVGLHGAQAVMDAYLYTETGDEGYAESAVEILAGHDHALNDYIRAFREVEGAPAMTVTARRQIEERIARLADNFLEHHVEWGAKNHGTNYIVDGVKAAATVLPDHPRSADWDQFAERMVATSWGKWGIEDSHLYTPIWFLPMVNYADLTGRREFFQLPTTVFYFHYYLQLLCPAGSVPEFGDGGWEGSWERHVALLERGAAEYGNGEMKWAARQIFELFENAHEPLQHSPHGFYNWPRAYGARIVDACRWADDTVAESEPTGGSREVLEDQISKKVVFRSGWQPDSTYLLLNYMDVPAFGVDGRDQLRTTIPVETEKTHHGHADENSICLLMSKGSVLLGESGYRETSTTGPAGEFRADTYHNRLVARHGIADPKTRLLPFLLDEGRYRFVDTRLLHFHNLRPLDLSRTRLTDADRGYRWDRVVVYLKGLDQFVLFDIVKVLTAGDYTFASLLYSERVVDSEAGRHHVAVDQVGSAALQPNSDRASLLICFPDLHGKREGSEQIRRSYRNQTCVYLSQAGSYRAGQVVTFTTCLVPVAKGSSPEPPLFEPLVASDGADGVGLRVVAAGCDLQLWAKADPEAAYLAENVRPRYTYESGRSRFGEAETDARFAYIDSRGDGTVRYGVVEATRLRYRDTELFSTPFLPIAQDDGASPRTGQVRWRAWEGEGGDRP